MVSKGSSIFYLQFSLQSYDCFETDLHLGWCCARSFYFPTAVHIYIFYYLFHTSVSHSTSSFFPFFWPFLQQMLQQMEGYSVLGHILAPHHYCSFRFCNKPMVRFITIKNMAKMLVLSWSTEWDLINGFYPLQLSYNCRFLPYYYISTSSFYLSSGLYKRCLKWS